MAPVGTVSDLLWSSSPELGVIIASVAFLVLSITLLALCARCNRSGSNAYDVSRSTNDGAVANGSPGARSGGDTVPDGAASSSSTWRSHRNMPASTLDRSKDPSP